MATLKSILDEAARKLKEEANKQNGNAQKKQSSFYNDFQQKKQSKSTFSPSVITAKQSAPAQKSYVKVEPAKSKSSFYNDFQKKKQSKSTFSPSAITAKQSAPAQKSYVKVEPAKSKSSFYNDFQQRKQSKSIFSPSAITAKQSALMQREYVSSTSKENNSFFNDFQSRRQSSSSRNMQTAFQSGKKSGFTFTPSTVMEKQRTAKGKKIENLEKEYFQDLKRTNPTMYYEEIEAQKKRRADAQRHTERMKKGPDWTENAAIMARHVDDWTRENVPKFFEWVGKSLYDGVAQADKSLADAVDFVIPTPKDFGFSDNPIDNSLEWYRNNARETRQASHDAGDKLGGSGWNVAGDLLSTTVAAAPQIAMGYASGGASAGSSLGASGAGAMEAAAVEGKSLMPVVVKQAVSDAMKNPTFYTTFATEAGGLYQDALEKGVSKEKATTTALAGGFFNSLIEMSGGVEKLNEQGNTLKALTESGLHEGLEEIAQGMTGKSVEKIVYDKNKNLFSLTDDDAIINPSRMAIEGAGGALAGFGYGSVPVAANYINNTVQTGSLINSAGEAQSLVNEGLDSREGTAARKYAEKMQKKLDRSGTISDWNAGRQVMKNDAAIAAENQFIDDISDVTGVPAVVRDNIDGYNGQYVSGGNERVELNRNGEMNIADTGRHEYTHVFKQHAPEAYAAFENYVFNAALETNREAVYNRLNRLEELYRQNGLEYNSDIGREEVVAELTSPFEPNIRKIAEGNPTLADKIRRGLDTAKAAVKTKLGAPYENNRGVQLTYSQLNQAEQLWNDALKETADNKGVDTAQANEGRNSITEIKGNNGNYGTGVYLDTKIFDGVHPRNWNKTLSQYVYNNLAGTDLMVYDNNGNSEIISFAKQNERATKYGANNSHKVIDKLARAKGNTNMLSIVHIDELLQTAQDNGSTDENNHQWLDASGWNYRKAYVQDKNGNIYETTLNIAKARDGRNILYALSNTKKIDEGVVPSTRNSERGSLTNRQPSVDNAESAHTVTTNATIDFAETSSSNNNITKSTPNVKHSVNENGEQTDAQQLLRDAQNRGKEHFDQMHKVRESDYSEDSWESYGEEFGTENVRRDMSERVAEAERRDREAEARRNSRYSEEDWANLEEPFPKGYDWTKDAENWDTPKEKPKTAAEQKAEAHEKLVQRMEEKGVSNPSELAEKTVSRADIRKAKRKYYLSPKGIHEIGTMAYTRVVDDMHPLWNYTDSFEKTQTRKDEKGKKIKFVAKGKQSPYKMAMNAKDATSRSAYLITDYLTDFDANIIGKGLNDTIAESGINLENLEDFNKYLVAKNAIAWLDEKDSGKYKKVYEDDTLNNVYAAQEIAEDFEKRYPEFKQAAENIYEWQRKLRKAWLVDTGVITQAQENYLWEMYPHYVPFYRAEMVNSAGGWTGLVEVDNVIKKAEGSRQKILSPIENIMYNTASFVNHAYKHVVVKAAVDMFDTLEIDPENNVLREFWTEVEPEDPTELVPTKFVEKTKLTENDLRRTTVQQRFSENVDKAFSGEITERTPITIGDTPSLYKKYGAGDNPLTITQSTMYKIAYPTGYFGAEETGHNLGIPALKQLPKQIAAPMAILKSNTQQGSLIALTEWEDANGNPVIIPLHLDKNGALGLTNEVASAYGKKDIEPLLTDKNGNSTVLYTKNNKSIHQLLSSRLQLPAAASDDTLVSHNISNSEGNVNSENFVPDERDLTNAADAADETAITRTLRQQTGVNYGVVSIMDNGKMRYFRVNNKEFMNAIDNTRKGRAGWLASFAAVSRARGALLTTLNPRFILATNFIKDAGTYLVNSSDVNKFKAIGAAGVAYVDMAKHAYHQVKGDVYSNEFTQYKAMGGQYSNLATQGTNQLKRAMDNRRGFNTAKKVAGFLPNVYLTAGDAIESAPRVGQFKRSLAQGDDIHEAFYQAKDVTVNFSRSGSWGKYINSFSNFFNAAIQGSDKMFRMAKNNPGSMAVGMAGLAMISAFAYGFSYLKRDDKYEEARKDLSNYQKNNNWNFYIGNGKFASVPKPRENAVLITAGEAVLDQQMYGQDDRFKEFFSNYMVGSFLPDGSVPIFTSLFELGKNEDYRGVPIVSKELQEKPKELQYDDNTTYYAKWIGEQSAKIPFIPNLSPKQIDHFLGNETGILSTAGETYFTPNGRKDSAAMWSFGLSKIFVKDAYYSTDMINSFYTNKGKAEKQANGYPGADTEYLSSRYEQAGNVMGIINQMVKDNADNKSFNKGLNMENNRWYKRAYTNYAAEYKDNPQGFSDEVYKEIKGLYDEDKSIFKIPEIDKEIKADKKSYTFTDPYTVMRYQKDLNNATDSAYRDVIASVEYQMMDNSDKAAALKKAKEDAVKEIKQAYVKNKGKAVNAPETSGAVEKPAKEAVTQAQAKKDRKTDITNNYVQKLSDDFAAANPGKDGYSVDTMMKIEPTKVKVNGKEYEVSGETANKIATAAEDKFYDNIESFYNGDVDVEYLIGRKADGTAYFTKKANGKKSADLVGKRYDANGNKRFNETDEGKIIFKLKEAAINAAAAEYAEEITGESIGKSSEPTKVSMNTSGGGNRFRSTRRSAGRRSGTATRRFSGRSSRRSSGHSSGRSSGRSSGQGSGGGSSGGTQGRGVTVAAAKPSRAAREMALDNIIASHGGNPAIVKALRALNIEPVQALKL